VESAAGVRRSRVFLHVGSPKTGTTFLQQVLWSQKRRAREQGLLLPLDSFFDHFLASLDVRGLAGRPEHPPHAQGIWQRVVEESRAWTGGTVLVSHELFASATAEQAEAAIVSLGRDAEVHVVLTARDLVRQIPAEWQEHVKHRSTKTFEDFVAGLQDDAAERSWFWRVQDFAAVVERWGRSLPRSQVHVVTVPPPGADPNLLWERFATLLGLDPGSFRTATHANTSLGMEQVELLRRVNAELGRRLPLPGPYAADAKNVLAHRVLAKRPGTPLALDAEGTAFALRRSAEIAAELARLDVDVVGDLSELVGEEAASAREPAGGGGHVPDDILLTESIAALAGLLDAHRARRMERDTARRELQQLQSRPVRFVVRRVGRRVPGARKALDAYRNRRALAERLRGAWRRR
jgi:hypothetical protein